MSLRTATLVSGSGRTLKNLLDLEAQGRLPITSVLVIASKPGIKAIEHARDAKVPVQVLKAKEVTAALDQAQPDLVVMAGYLKQWKIPDRYVGKAINIHPSLLPLFGGRGFYGRYVHEAALRSGMRVSGCTVHFVTKNYDEGPIIGQRAVPILPSDDADSLAARVFEAELELLPACIRGLAAGDSWLDKDANRTRHRA